MKRLILEELMILSLTEKKAKRVQFDPQKTVIKGSNQVGKSSLIKSIYYTLGATPGLMHPNWLKAEPITFLRFKVDEEPYTVLRYDKKRFVILDNQNNLRTFNFKEVSSFLNELLEFKLVLNNRQGEPETPPPTYLFLPYYIDQDKSWSKSWDSFANLAQFANWKKPLVEYHTGIKGNLYYTTKSELDQTRRELEETTKEIDTLNKILRNINKKLSEVNLNIAIEDFNEEIKELLEDCDLLKIEQNKIKQKLTDLHGQKISIGTKINIVQKSIKEAEKDYKYVVHELEDDVDCPTCGAQYENNFAERFSIAEDQERLIELLNELKADFLKVQDKINLLNEQLISKKTNYEKIQVILNKKQSDIKLIDIIENEGKKRVKEIFKEEQNLIYNQIGKAEKERRRLEEKMKEIDSKGKNRKERIMTLYRSTLNDYLKKLNIDTEKFSDQVFKRIDSTIKETGSALPRALLAYYFTLIKVMSVHSTSTFCPIIIDSPNQQEQDKENLEAILHFINNNTPDKSQLIIGLVDDDENSFNLDTKNSLLKRSEYDEVFNIIRPILEEGIFNDGSLLF